MRGSGTHQFTVNPNTSRRSLVFGSTSYRICLIPWLKKIYRFQRHYWDIILISNPGDKGTSKDESREIKHRQKKYEQWVTSVLLTRKRYRLKVWPFSLQLFHKWLLRTRKMSRKDLRRESLRTKREKPVLPWPIYRDHRFSYPLYKLLNLLNFKVYVSPKPNNPSSPLNYNPFFHWWYTSLIQRKK